MPPRICLNACDASTMDFSSGAHVTRASISVNPIRSQEKVAIVSVISYVGLKMAASNQESPG